jgi:hypothetical protein
VDYVILERRRRSNTPINKLGTINKNTKAADKNGFNQANEIVAVSR